MNRYRNDLMIRATINQQRDERREQRRRDAASIFAVCMVIVAVYLIAAFVAQVVEAQL